MKDKDVSSPGCCECYLFVWRYCSDAVVDSLSLTHAYTYVKCYNALQKGEKKRKKMATKEIFMKLKSTASPVLCIRFQEAMCVVSSVVVGRVFPLYASSLSCTFPSCFVVSFFFYTTHRRYYDIRSCSYSFIVFLFCFCFATLFPLFSFSYLYSPLKFF